MMGDLTEQLFFCLEVVCGMMDFNNLAKAASTVIFNSELHTCILLILLLLWQK